MRHGSLFSGIGGFDLAAEWMGWENVFHCEFNEFCQKILKQHFPNSIGYGDITKTDFTEWRGKVDIVSGGFPCQPYSLAGKRKGRADDRHLWPEMLRAIREIQPSWIVGENVPGLLNWERGMVLAEIKADLEGAGFEVFPPCILPACSKNAPHRRDRLWVVAYSKSNFSRHGFSNEGPATQEVPEKRFNEPFFATNTDSSGLQGKSNNGIADKIWQKRNEQFSVSLPSTWEKFPTQPPVCGGNDGIPNRVDRIKALGNAVVPQVVFEIFKAIEEYEINRHTEGDS